VAATDENLNLKQTKTTPDSEEEKEEKEEEEEKEMGDCPRPIFLK
jgi:hypothetical protein